MPDPTALIALRSEHHGDDPEAELLTVDRIDDRVLIVTEDGREINVDAAELQAAIGQAA